jgi:hypothetical protein
MPRCIRIERLWDSAFARFVTEYRVTRLARRLKIGNAAVYHWIRGATSPRVETALTITQLAREFGTTLTLEQIYQHTQHARDLRGGQVRAASFGRQLELKLRRVAIDEARDNGSIRLLLAEIYCLVARLLAPAVRTAPIDGSRHTSAAQASAQ